MCFWKTTYFSSSSSSFILATSKKLGRYTCSKLNTQATNYYVPMEWLWILHFRSEADREEVSTLQTYSFWHCHFGSVVTISPDRFRGVHACESATVDSAVNLFSVHSHYKSSVSTLHNYMMRETWWCPSADAVSTSITMILATANYQYTKLCKYNCMKN